MTLQAHLTELAAKHKALEASLAELQAHAISSSDAHIAELKRRKLRIKDEITHIERANHAA